MIACGTSYHAGLIAKNLIEGWARIPTEVEAASEFRYRNPIITPTTLVVAVSQSGETADTLAAIRDAIKGAKVFGITNVVGSPVARESDGVSTPRPTRRSRSPRPRAYRQVAALTLLALLLAQVSTGLTTSRRACCSASFPIRPSRSSGFWIPKPRPFMRRRSLQGRADGAVRGRGMGAPISYEGALKLKEILPACRGVSRRRNEARPH